MKPHEIQEKLGLTRIRDRNWYVQPSCATTGDGLYEGLTWLTSNIKTWRAGRRRQYMRFPHELMVFCTGMWILPMKITCLTEQLCYRGPLLICNLLNLLYRSLPFIWWLCLSCVVTLVVCTAEVYVCFALHTCTATFILTNMWLVYHQLYSGKYLKSLCKKVPTPYVLSKVHRLGYTTSYHGHSFSRHFGSTWLN